MNPETSAVDFSATPRSRRGKDGLSRRPGPVSTPKPEILARARELERELGRPLREVIDGPLNDEELEELVLARMISGDELITAEEFFRKHGLD